MTSTKKTGGKPEAEGVKSPEAGSGKEAAAKGRSEKGTGVKSGNGKDPSWANGLKQLYDSVVEEPLPDSFNDLLAQFDDDDAGDPSGNGSKDGGRAA